MRVRINWRTFLRIAGMSLGVGVVDQFAPMLTQQADTQIGDFFTHRSAR
jgi:hypothetical protein